MSGGAVVRTACRRVGAIVCAVAMLCAAAHVDAQSASATPASDVGASGATAGPAQPGQVWEVYVEAGGSLELEVTIAATAALRSITAVPVPPGSVLLNVTTSAGTQQLLHSEWDPWEDTTVAGTVTDPAAPAGVWRVELDSVAADGAKLDGTTRARMGTSSRPWRVVPRDADGTARAGRVWTDTRLQSYVGLARDGIERWDQTHYALSETGVSYRVTEYGFNGINSSMRVTNLGLVDDDCQPIHRSARQGDVGVRTNPGVQCPSNGVPYKLFFEPPDGTLPATAPSWSGATTWVMPTYSAPSIPDLAWTQTAGGAHWGGDLAVTLAGQPGTVEVRVDVDGDGTFDGPRDVQMSQVLGLGTSVVAWDGRDGAGAPVHLSQPVAFQAELVTSGELHLVSSDVEYREGGIEVEALSGPQAGSTALWWDDTAVTGCHRDALSTNGPATCTGTVPTALVGDGVESRGGVHAWGADADPITYTETTWGDGKYIDNWTHSYDAALSEVLHLAGGVEVAKTADADTLTPGDTTTHTWTVTNDGDVDLLGLVVVDDLSQVLPAGRVEEGSVTASAGTVALDLEAQVLTWIGDLAPAAEVTVAYDVVTDVDTSVPGIVDVVSVLGWDKTATVAQALVAHAADPGPDPEPGPDPGVPAPAEPGADAPGLEQLAVTGPLLHGAALLAVGGLLAGVALVARARRHDLSTALHERTPA
ncbi:MAG: DUF11 domain-containing protein [Micrococcales bacterium]|nr:DUF11 domain-containing protein [Micrococcales bacterium]